MASAAAPPIRAASRRARSLLLGRRGGQSTPSGGGASKSASPKEETPWPPSLRYAFYAACVVAAPLSAGQAVAMSPRLRERMLGDDVEEEEEMEGGSGGGSSGVSSQQIISWVRHYWGVEDYVPPVDRPPSRHVVPGHRHEWQESNQSSFLKMLGMYAPNETDPSVITGLTDGGENAAPISLENEPKSHVRKDQRILNQYLSTKTNPSGVKTRLTLLPRSDMMGDGGIGGDIMSGGNVEPGYENECTLPGDLPLGKLRDHCKGSMAQVVKRDLAESDPDFRSRSTQETLRTASWNEECRWTVGFAADDGGGGGRSGSGTIDAGGNVDAGGLGDGDEGAAFAEAFGSGADPSAAKELRRDTSVHSSWSSFPDPSGSDGAASQGSNPSANPFAESAVAAAAAGNSGGPASASAESLRAQKLEYQIAELTRELSDPSSLRDRDGMQEELRAARAELRGLRPWWRRFW